MSEKPTAPPAPVLPDPDVIVCHYEPPPAPGRMSDEEFNAIAEALHGKNVERLVSETRRARGESAAKDAELIACRGAKAAWKARAEKAEAERDRLHNEVNRSHSEILSLKAEIARLRALASFGKAVIDDYVREDGDFGDLDGGWVQDKAIELGLLVHPATPHDPNDCEACYEEPGSCYVLSDIAREALEKEMK